MINEYLKYIGCKKDSKKKTEMKGDVSETKEVFKPAVDLKVALRYLEYLKELDHYQKDTDLKVNIWALEYLTNFAA